MKNRLQKINDLIKSLKEAKDLLVKVKPNIRSAQYQIDRADLYNVRKPKIKEDKSVEPSKEQQEILDRDQYLEEGWFDNFNNKQVNEAAGEYTSTHAPKPNTDVSRAPKLPDRPTRTKKGNGYQVGSNFGISRDQVYKQLVDGYKFLDQSKNLTLDQKKAVIDAVHSVADKHKLNDFHRDVGAPHIKRILDDHYKHVQSGNIHDDKVGEYVQNMKNWADKHGHSDYFSELVNPKYEDEK